MPKYVTFAGKKPYTNVSGGVKVDNLRGMRQGLFQTAIKVNSKGLDAISVQVESKLAAAMVKLARQARDMARSRAPVRSGALRAGIYATGAVSQSQLNMIRDGNAPGLSSLMGHTAPYFRAITAAARARAGKDDDGVQQDAYIPGSTDDGVGKSILSSHRTQRIKPKITADRLRDELFQGVQSETMKDYVEANLLLPYNEIGKTGRGSFFVGIGSAMYYSAWVDQGTAIKRAHPFFTPAALWLTARAPAVMAQAMNELKIPANVQAQIMS